MNANVRARELGDALLTLAETCVGNAQLAADEAGHLDMNESLALKNHSAAALAATQAWLTATRQDGGRR